VFDAGVAPENLIQPLVRLSPSRLLFVDACDLRATPGSHVLLDDADFDSLAGSFLSTHTLPLSLTVSLLRLELPGASIALLGVQPASLVLGAALSEPLADALPGLVATCRRWAASADGGVPE
jgi:hydrogenase maturation protease